MLHLDGGPVQLDDQDRARALGVLTVHGGLGGLDRQGVHHLDRRGHHAGADDGRHRLARALDRGERRQQRLDGLRQPRQPYGDLGGDAERALRAYERAEQVIAGPLGDLDDLSVGRDDLTGQHVVDREAVLQAVRPAGVLRDVAPDGADLLAGRVGRVVVAAGPYRLGDVQVDHARLDDGALVVDVDLQDAAHAGSDDQYAVGAGERTPGQPGTRAARDVRDAFGGAGPDDLGDLLGPVRQDHDPGRRPVVGQPVALVRAQLSRVGNDVLGTGDDPEPLREPFEPCCHITHP
jgi:hypothetical protein